MAKNSSKKNKKKKKLAAASKMGAQGAASEGGRPTVAPPATSSLGAGRVVRTKIPKVSAKEQAALAKQEARAKWGERMTAEGR